MRERLKSILSKLKRFTSSLAIIFLILLILLFIANTITGWVQIQDANVIASGFGAIGTLMLAWFTFKTIQQNEKLVQQQQLEHQQARSRPVLRQIGEFKSNEDMCELLFSLENIGRGPAYNIKFTTEIKIPELGVSTVPDSDYSDLDIDSELPNLDSINSNIYSNEGVQIDGPGATGGVLQEGSNGEFSYRVDFMNLDVEIKDIMIGDNDKLPKIMVFDYLLAVLKKEGVDVAFSQFKIQYEDVFGKEYEEELPVKRLLIEDINSVSDIMSSPNYSVGQSHSLKRISLEDL